MTGGNPNIMTCLHHKHCISLNFFYIMVTWPGLNHIQCCSQCVISLAGVKRSFWKGCAGAEKTINRSDTWYEGPNLLIHHMAYCQGLTNKKKCQPCEAFSHSIICVIFSPGPNVFVYNKFKHYAKLLNETGFCTRHQEWSSHMVVLGRHLRQGSIWRMSHSECWLWCQQTVTYWTQWPGALLGVTVSVNVYS